MKIQIQYCVQWNYLPQAVGLTAELKEALPGVEVELVESSGGAFEVTVDGQQVFSKLGLDRFPAYQEIPTLIAVGWVAA